MPRRRAFAFLALILLAGTAAFSLYRLRPRISDAQTPVSLENLKRHVATIAAEPHPVESDANRRVAAYIVAELERLGLAPQEQEGIIRSPRGSEVRVRNIVCRIRAAESTDAAARGGSNPSSAALLACHYDSHPRAPGAGDDGNAVAGLLEMARLLSEGEPPVRDIVLLFTDGEEAGLLGARVWVRDNPDLMGCRVVANFEARGTSGPAIMFETAGAPVDFFHHGYARASPQPVTSSIASAVYERMPNGTDFSVFRAAGMTGVNFAFIDGYANYHTARDDPAHLSEASLLHQAAQMHEAARYFATAPDDQFERNRRAASFKQVYFDVASIGVVSYSQDWVLPIAALAVLAAGLGMIRLWPRVSLLAGALLRYALVLVAVVGWVHLVTRLPIPKEMHRWTPLAFAAAAIVVCAAVPFAIASSRTGRRRYTRAASERAALAALLSLLVAGTLASAVFFAPGSYAFAWPTLLMGAAACIRRPRHRLPALTAAAVVSTVILLPLAWLVTVAMTMHLLAIGAAVLLLIGWLWRPSLAPLLRPRWPIAAVAITAAMALLAGIYFA